MVLGAQADGSGDAGAALSDRQRELWAEFVAGGWALNRAIAREIDQTSADWRLLEMLAQAPQMRISDLAEATKVGLSTVSRQVTRFLERGYVARVDAAEVGETDARQKWVTLTALGRAELAPILQARDHAVRRLIVDRLSDDEFEQLCTIVGVIGKRLTDDA